MHENAFADIKSCICPGKQPLTLTNKRQWLREPGGGEREREEGK